MQRAFAGSAAALVLLAAAPALAQGYGYQSPSYSYTRPPYAYQAPPYSYTPPSYGYEPPGYVYTPPGEYRRGYYTTMPEYNRAYQYPQSAYENPNYDQGYRRRRFRDPIYNRFHNPRNPTDVWHSAPPYESPGR
jgi:hypothetical protein